MSEQLDFKKVDNALRRARDTFMVESLDALEKNKATYEEKSIFRAFSESICIAFETHVIRELGKEFSVGGGTA